MNIFHFVRLLFFSFLTMTLTIGCLKSDAPKEYVDLSNYILPNNKLSPTLKQILEITGIEHVNMLDSVVQATQSTWLRKPGTERWHMDKNFEHIRDQIEPLFKQLGVLDEIKPLYKRYNEVLILGATLNAMRLRFAYALDLWRNGIHFDTIIFLVGERPRAPERESEEELYNRTNKFLPIKDDWQQPDKAPATETEIARMIVDQADLPEEFKKSVKIHFINASLQPTVDGGLRTPNTADTIKLWLKNAIPQDSILAISNQPYVGYQHAVLKTFTPREMRIETVGPKANPWVNIDVHLDNLARWLYQESVLKKQSK